jgi:TRAP-type C4-dicarboxylate transport system permease small subunit
VISRLAKVFLCTTCIWLIACAVAWFGGSYAYATFNGSHYSPGRGDVMTVVRLALVIAFAFTLLTWIKTRDS